MMKVEYDYPLLGHNTFGVEARAACFVTYDTADDLAHVVELLHERWAGKPSLHIGGGSNLLFLTDFDGVVLHSAIRGLECSDAGESVRVRAGAGIEWDELVAHCVAHGLHGLENLSLIPGEVGAAAVQNIGAYGMEAQDVIESVETVDLRNGRPRVFDVSECGYAYRRSVFKETLRGRYAVTHVCFRLSRRFEPRLDYGGISDALQAAGVCPREATAAEVRQAVISIRQAKLPDPKKLGNAGSFFMNPVVDRATYERIESAHPGMPHYDAGEGRVKIPAGWLIEQCGWKGRSLGRAAVHDRQALVLVNKGGATGHDILALCNAVRADVARQFGIDLRPEVNIIGEE